MAADVGVCDRRDGEDDDDDECAHEPSRYHTPRVHPREEHGKLGRCATSC
jgi:hypothetical protein